MEEQLPSYQVTGINICSLLGIVVNPLSKKHWYRTLLMFMVAVAVGVLAGSSLLFLLAGALEIDIMDWSYRKTYIIKMTVVLAAAFVFFNFEQLLKLLLAKLMTRHKKPIRNEKNLNICSTSEQPLVSPDQKGIVRTMSVIPSGEITDDAGGLEMKSVPSTKHVTYAHREIKAESSINMKGMPVSTFNHHHPNTRASIVSGINIAVANAAAAEDESPFDDIDANFGTAENPNDENKTRITPRRQRTESEVSFVAKSLSQVEPVAWMIIFGDGIHNFVDGLSIGAGMARSFPEGLSIALAVLAEELPHELGDLAVLLRAGLTLKRALLFNFLSACLCYAGFVIGVVVGESPTANTFIYAIAAGLFLYIALTDLLPELSPDANPDGSSLPGQDHGNENVLPTKEGSLRHLCSHLAIADSGMIIGYIVIVVLALYSDDIRVSMEMSLKATSSNSTIN